MKSNRKFKMEEEAVSAVIGVILMVAITVAIAATVYVYVSGMLGTPTTTAPKISWTPNAATNVLTITKGATDAAYAASTSTPNLIFKDSDGIEYYVNGTAGNYHIYLYNPTSSPDNASTDNINGGDIIEGFENGTYTIIWKPTNEVIGTASF